MLLKFCPTCSAHHGGDLTYCPIDGTPLELLDDPYIGMTVAGRYVVEEKLGSGGMGAVYRARHEVIGRDVALKFLNPEQSENERQRRRFLGEARAANQIDHDHIIDISDYGETDEGLVYMVMEHLQGRTLEDELKRVGPLPLRRALRIAQQVASGLARAHELGVVHRDVKPSNVFLLNRHGRDFVKLLDFGIARIEQDIRITAQGSIVGTPEYIAPEQIRSAAATPATDMYALGCVLFEMLTNRLPFEGNMTVQLVKHLNDAPPPPSTLRSEVPEALDELVLKLLAKTPEQRFRDAFQLADALLEVLTRLPGPASGPAPRSDRAARMVDGQPARAPREHDWRGTLQAFEQMTARVYPDGTAPDELTRSLANMRDMLEHIAQLKAQLEEAAAYATALERDVRGPRGQIGAAMDELGKDESRARSRIEALEAAIERGETRVDGTLEALTEHAARLPRPAAEDPSLPLSLDGQQHATLGAVLEGIGELYETRQRVVQARAQLKAQRSAQQDLTFQLAQLKSQLESLNRRCTLDQDVAQGRIRRVEAALRAKVVDVAQVAAKISAHFQECPGLQALELEGDPGADAGKAAPG